MRLSLSNDCTFQAEFYSVTQLRILDSSADFTKVSYRPSKWHKLKVRFLQLNSLGLSVPDLVDILLADIVYTLLISAFTALKQMLSNVNKDIYAM